MRSGSLRKARNLDAFLVPGFALHHCVMPDDRVEKAKGLPRIQTQVNAGQSQRLLRHLGFRFRVTVLRGAATGLA
jgi:hypothetical protein